MLKCWKMCLMYYWLEGVADVPLAECVTDLTLIAHHMLCMYALA